MKSPFVVGSDTGKWSKDLMGNKMSNDIVIKYRTNRIKATDIQGESHSLVLMGTTTSTKTAYAYPEGKASNGFLRIPLNANILIRVNAVVTVIGGTNASYKVGLTEAFSYHTAFINRGNPVQLGAAGGEKDWDLRESLAVSTSLYIEADNNGTIRFGLKDTEENCRRSWELKVDYEVNLMRVIEDFEGYNPIDYALYQNGNIILLQDGDYLLWN